MVHDVGPILSLLVAMTALVRIALSQKIRLSHEVSSQKNLRARTTSLTAIPRQGRSETVRA